MKIQTYLPRRQYEKFKRYMERRGSTVYEAGAELIIKGLENAEIGEERGNRPVKKEEPEPRVKIEKTLKISRFIQSYLKPEASEKFKGYAILKGVSDYRAVHDLILRGLVDFERETKIN